MLIADLALRSEAQVLVDKHSRGASAKAIFQQTDVRDWVQLERMFEIAEREFGEIDIVCPGAGVYEPVCCSLWQPQKEARTTTARYSADYHYMHSTGAISGARRGLLQARTRLLAVGTP